MENWVTDIMEKLGYLGVYLMMVLENVFPPIPSEIVLPFGGFLTTYTDLTVLGVVVAATAGSVIGAMILYSIGMLLDIERLERIVDRWGHILRLKKEDVRKADAWFDKYGYWTVLFCRMVPIVRSLISIPAGMAQMNFWLFLLFTTIGTIMWNIILITLGAALGANWQNIIGFMNLYKDFVYAALIIGTILFIIWLIWKKRKRK
ncbi:DedA family protein [Oceanobacillus sp. FSL K6-2867]|uniref:DedA family protein n=1 Tax=Oceanobacillus sp. FSL K6-2867 TaxID=2954748 RepID=UPI0030D7CB88